MLTPQKTKTDLGTKGKRPSEVIIQSLAINARTSKLILASTKLTGNYDD